MYVEVLKFQLVFAFFVNLNDQFSYLEFILLFKCPICIAAYYASRFSFKPQKERDRTVWNKRSKVLDF